GCVLFNRPVELAKARSFPHRCGYRQPFRPIRERRQDCVEFFLASEALRDLCDGFVMRMTYDRVACRLEPLQACRKQIAGCALHPMFTKGPMPGTFGVSAINPFARRIVLE